MIMRPEDRPTMSEQARAVRTRAITCPRCNEDTFTAISSWWKSNDAGGQVQRRARKCRRCGYEDNETVSLPVLDNERDFVAETASPGSSMENQVESNANERITTNRAGDVPG